MFGVHGLVKNTHNCTSLAREALSKVWTAAKMTDMSVTNSETVRQGAEDKWRFKHTTLRSDRGPCCELAK